jgi:cold shock CspA family protein
MTGRIVTWPPGCVYGFVRADATGCDWFVHAAHTAPRQPLPVGARVRFTTAIDERSGRAHAADVCVIDEPGAAGDFVP